MFYIEMDQNFSGTGAPSIIASHDGVGMAAVPGDHYPPVIASEHSWGVGGPGIALEVKSDDFDGIIANS